MPNKKKANVKSIKKKSNSKSTNSSKKSVNVSKKKTVKPVVKEKVINTDNKIKKEKLDKNSYKKISNQKSIAVKDKNNFSKKDSVKENNKKKTTVKAGKKDLVNNEKIKEKKVKIDKTVIDKKEEIKVNNEKINKKEKLKSKNNKSKLSTKEIKETKLFNKKLKKCFLLVLFICITILVFEAAYFIKYKMDIDKKTVYYDTLNSVSIDESDIIAVGSSNFRYSKYNDYTKGLEKAKLIKYNKTGKVLYELKYDNGINTTFSSIISIDDGYIVVGSGTFSKDEENNGAREAIIIKYDKDGKLIWEKFYQVLTNTRFNKVISVNDGYIAIGQSIYANMEMGNHTTGGGIIVKYDKDGNVVWKNNHGGTKSGNFNDIVEVNGDLYVVGKDGTDSGNLIKYDKNGKYLWHKNYSYTDSIGFTGITYLDNHLFVVGSKKILPKDIKEEDDRNTTNTDSLLVKYNLDGKIMLEKTFGGSNYERYNSIQVYNKDLYVVGHITSTDAGLNVNTNGELMTGLIVRYDSNGNMLKKMILGGSNNDNLTDITTDGASLYITGYSNSNDGNIITSKNNGKDYFGKVIKLDSKLRRLLIK